MGWKPRPDRCVHPNCFHCPYDDCEWDGGWGETDKLMLEGLGRINYSQRGRKGGAKNGKND